MFLALASLKRTLKQATISFFLLTALCPGALEEQWNTNRKTNQPTQPTNKLSYSWLLDILVYSILATSMGWLLESPCDGTWLENVTEMASGLDWGKRFTWFPSLLDILSFFLILWLVAFSCLVIKHIPRNTDVSLHPPRFHSPYSSLMISWPQDMNLTQHVGHILPTEDVFSGPLLVISKNTW